MQTRAWQYLSTGFVFCVALNICLRMKENSRTRNKQSGLLWGPSNTALRSSNGIQHVRGEIAFSPILQQNPESFCSMPLLGWKDSGAGDQEETSDDMWLRTGGLTSLVCTQV